MQQSIVLPSKHAESIEERERAIVLSAVSPTNMIGIATYVLLGDVQQRGLAKTRREVFFSEQTGELKATIEVDTASWFGETLSALKDAVTTIGDWVASAASGAAGTFRGVSHEPGYEDSELRRGVE